VISGNIGNSFVNAQDVWTKRILELTSVLSNANLTNAEHNIRIIPEMKKTKIPDIYFQSNPKCSEHPGNVILVVVEKATDR
jgi:hypothetical protein